MDPFFQEAKILGKIHFYVMFFLIFFLTLGNYLVEEKSYLKVKLFMHLSAYILQREIRFIFRPLYHRDEGNENL